MAMKVSTCLFALSLTALLLVSFPFIAACIYTMLTKNAATADDFLANQQIILQCLAEYVKVLGEMFVASNQQILYAAGQYSTLLGEVFSSSNQLILQAFEQYSTALVTIIERYSSTFVTITPKLVDLSLTTLTATLNVSTLILMSSIVVIYGLIFQFAVIKTTIEDLLRPVLDAIKEIWLSVKSAIVAIWSVSPVSCMFVIVLYALVLISNPKNFPAELINSFTQS